MAEEQQQAQNVPNTSERNKESFGIIPHASERKIKRSVSVPNTSERTTQHTLSVKEVARMFEDANAACTERAIINWVKPNKHGIARLDGYYDPEERKWYITPESTYRVIEEEQRRSKSYIPNSSAQGKEIFRTVPHSSEQQKNDSSNVPNASEQIEENNEAVRKVSELERDKKDLEHKLRESEIASRVKDHVLEKQNQFIDQLTETNKSLIGEMKESFRRIGKLEERLFLIAGPKATVVGDIHEVKEVVKEEPEGNENTEPTQQ